MGVFSKDDDAVLKVAAAAAGRAPTAAANAQRTGSAVKCVGALNMTLPLTDTSAGVEGDVTGPPPPQ